MIYPGTQDPLSGNVGQNLEDSIDSRKKALMEKLMNSNSGGGLHGSGRPMFGSAGSGLGRGGVDYPQGGLPQLTYNPFLTQVSGRSGEFFPYHPSDLSNAEIQQSQNGDGPVPGGGPTIGNAYGSPSSQPNEIATATAALGHAIGGASPIGGAQPLDYNSPATQGDYSPRQLIGVGTGQQSQGGYTNFNDMHAAYLQRLLGAGYGGGR